MAQFVPAVRVWSLLGGGLDPTHARLTFVARMVRMPLYPVERHVDGAIVWLDDHWRGGVFVPDELLPLVAVA